MYTVLGSPVTRGFRLVWMLEELGVEYEINPLAPRSKEMRAYNPSGKAPALLDGEDCILDSVACVQYLADKHQKLTHKAGTVARGQQDAWVQFACDSLDSNNWTIQRHEFVYPKELRALEAVKPAALYDLNRACGFLADGLGDQTYAMGEEFTVPDIIIGHCLGWCLRNGVTLPDTIANGYWQRIKARPAYQRTQALRKECAAKT